MTKTATVTYHGVKYSCYEVDETGKIESWRSLKTLKANSDTTCHYPRVLLIDDDGNKKKVLVHRIVAEAFVPLTKPSDSITDKEWEKTPKSVKQFIMKTMCVNHIDHDKENYHFSNLEWVTHEENARKRNEFYGV